MSVFLAVATGVRILVTPIVGPLVDKWNRVKIIYMTDYIRGAVYLVGGVYLITGPSQTGIIVILYIVTILSTMNGALFSPAVASAVPEIVGHEDLQKANGANSIVGSVQQIIGVLLGAIAYMFFGLMWILIINAVSFFFSAISEMFITTPYKNETLAMHKNGKAPDDKTFSAAVQYVLHQKGLLILLVLILFINFAITPLFNIGIPYLFKVQLQRTALELSYITIVFSLAMLLGGSIISVIQIKSTNNTIKRGISFFTLGFVIIAILVFLLLQGIITYPWFFGLILATNGLLGVMIIFINVPIQTNMITAIEPSFRGRVVSITGALSTLAIPFAQLLGGWVLDTFGIVTLAVVCALLIMIPAIFFVMNRQIKVMFDDIDHQTKLPDEPQLVSE